MDASELRHRHGAMWDITSDLTARRRTRIPAAPGADDQQRFAHEQGMTDRLSADTPEELDRRIAEQDKIWGAYALWL